MDLTDFNFILFISNYVIPDQSSVFYTSGKLECAFMTDYRGHHSFFYHPDTMACITLPDKIYSTQNLVYDNGFQYWMNNVLTSPDYPSLYPNDLNKTYLIIGRPGQKINLILDAVFAIESTQAGCNGPRSIGAAGCKFDFLELHGVRYCGSEAPGPIIIPTGQNTSVQFVTDYSNGCTGFNLRITYTNDVESPENKGEIAV